MLETIKTVVEITAYASAAGFFVWKVVSGFLIVNLSIEAKAERVPAAEGRDHLAVAVTISKGSIGSLQLHDARVRVTYDEGQQELELIGYNRLSSELKDSPLSRRRITFERPSKRQPLLFLTPEEKATFSTCTDVPRHKPSTIEAAILGILTGGRRFGQWRSSIVSLPREAS